MFSVVEIDCPHEILAVKLFVGGEEAGGGNHNSPIVDIPYDILSFYTTIVLINCLGWLQAG